MNNKKHAKHKKSAVNYALNNALAAADSGYLEQRPDPIADRTAYEAWYYALTPAQQQAEWDMYYRREEEQKGISEESVQTVAGHSVSKNYAHSHITPEPEISSFRSNPVEEVTKITKDLKESEISSYDGGFVAVKKNKKLAETRTTTDTQQNNSNKVKDSIYQSALDEKKAAKKSNPFMPLLAAMSVGTIVMLLAYNQIVFAQVKQYVRPGSELNTPVIISPESNACEDQENNIFIPKINVNSPVVYNETSWDNDNIDVALERGVVHYGTTALPGNPGNNVILGHSSGNLLNQGDFKYEFVLLDALENDDTFTMCYNNERYVYKIFRKEIIDPTDLTYIYQQQEGVPGGSQHITTLITCHPPGTSWKRLIIQGVQISPTPSSNQTSTTPVQGIENSEVQAVPSDSRSFWETVTGWL